MQNIFDTKHRSTTKFIAEQWQRYATDWNPTRLSQDN